MPREKYKALRYEKVHRGRSISCWVIENAATHFIILTAGMKSPPFPLPLGHLYLLATLKKKPFDIHFNLIYSFLKCFWQQRGKAERHLKGGKCAKQAWLLRQGLAHVWMQCLIFGRLRFIWFQWLWSLRGAKQKSRHFMGCRTVSFEGWKVFGILAGCFA